MGVKDKIRRKYGEKASALLEMVPEGLSPYVSDDLLTCIKTYGIDTVTEVLEREHFHKMDGKWGFTHLDAPCKALYRLKQLGEPEGETVKYDMKFSGRVQDVGFRATSHDYMNMLDLKGSAENLPDGDVLVTVEGPQSRIDLLKELLKEKFEISNIEETQAGRTVKA